MDCPNCGTENLAGSRFCNQCAAPLSRRCQKCAFDNAPAAKFCSQCALPLNDQVQLNLSGATLAEIHGWFTEGFDTADLKDAKALLDELNA